MEIIYLICEWIFLIAFMGLTISGLLKMGIFIANKIAKGNNNEH